MNVKYQAMKKIEHMSGRESAEVEEAWSLDLLTPQGRISVKIQEDGEIVITADRVISVKPRAANAINIRQEDR